MSEVWPARAAEAADVTRLLIAFRDWLGEELPDGDAFAASVAHLVDDPATEFLLGRLDAGAGSFASTISGTLPSVAPE